MGFVLDIILLAIGIGCIIYGWKCGFFKAFVSLVSGVCALLVAYTFTPSLAQFIKEKIVIDKVAGSITTTFASIAEAGKENGEKVIYDLKLLLESFFGHGVNEQRVACIIVIYEIDLWI